jgi:7-cyano-7-deazaguanine synthase
MEKTVVLHSGGLDSTTVLAIVIQYLSLRHDLSDFEIHTLSVYYGQRHAREIESALKVVDYYRSTGINIIQHKAELALSWQGSALLGSSEVPRNRDESTMSTSIPSTYVPARNTFLLGLAVSLAEAVGAGEVYSGFNALDYSGYPDCRPEYVAAYNDLIKLGTKAGVEGKGIKIVAPIINASKKEVILKGMQLYVPYKLTWSCYEGGEKPCGQCDSCIIRTNGFKALGLTDPALS